MIYNNRFPFVGFEKCVKVLVKESGLPVFSYDEAIPVLQSVFLFVPFVVLDYVIPEH